MKQYKQRATMDFTVSSGKELGKIQKIIDYANWGIKQLKK